MLFRKYSNIRVSYRAAGARRDVLTPAYQVSEVHVHKKTDKARALPGQVAWSSVHLSKSGGLSYI
jgi:hypothetical protein